MKKSVLIVFTAIICALQAHSQSELSQKTIDSIMELSFYEFDQNMDGGWRYYSNKEDFESATTLIKLYLEKHQDIESAKRGIISFHCGQMLALLDKNEEAIPYMEASKMKENDVMNWDVYVDATIAFLKKERETFDKKKAELKEKSRLPQDQNRNLIFLNKLEAHFDKTYMQAVRAE
ncbi:hypothetical protein [Winogradskyella alexanderae]|uniref:DUF4919 domain-containing protein n=1 Tax=Winogradskyella alexanderae TaxID=2877123 RepID=A0ABS7XNX4_9FLAO|nr:hypothetical protein [Winogradskyella alexanderae]MCA0131704.1 hypothetical protein [Winogradskyella alexanderae]